MKHGVAVLAWSPLGQGRLGDGDPRPGRMQAGDARTAATKAALKVQGDKYGVGIAAAAYAWIMAHPAGIIPIVGTQNLGRIAESADAYKVEWSRAEWYGVLVASLGENLP